MKKRLSSLWWGCILIGECFIASNATSTTNYGIRNLPYIQFDYKLIVIFLLLCVCVGTIYRIIIARKSICLDIIPLLLFLRVIFVMIPALYINKHYYWGNLLSYIIAPIVYFLILNRKILIKDLLPFFKCFSVITGIQCLWLFITSPVPYSDPLYKAFFVSPAGASNYLASAMVISFIFVFYSKNSKKRIWYIIGLISIFFTKSRTSLFTYILVPVIDKFVTFIKCRRVSSKSLIIFGGILLLCVFLISFFYGSIIMGTISNLISSFVLGFSTTGADITSGRIDQFLVQFYNACDYFLFGSGFSFGDSQGAMHNFLLESFFVSGFVGFIIQVFLLRTIYKYIEQQNKNMGWVMLAIFMVASFEKVLFTISGEFILWSLVGVIYNENKIYNTKNIDIRSLNVHQREYAIVH